MAERNIGKITQIIGAVLDVKYAEGQLPEINEAIEITRSNGEKLVVEVAQHLGDDTVRCIAMVRQTDLCAEWMRLRQVHRSQYRLENIH